MATTFEITGVSKVTYEHYKGEKTSTVKTTDFWIETSSNIDKNQYEENGLPNKDGTHAAAGSFIAGLVACIRLAEERGWRNGADYMKWVIEKLSQGYASVSEVREGER